MKRFCVIHTVPLHAAQGPERREREITQSTGGLHAPLHGAHGCSFLSGAPTQGGRRRFSVLSSLSLAPT